MFAIVLAFQNTREGSYYISRHEHMGFIANKKQNETALSSGIRKGWSRSGRMDIATASHWGLCAAGCHSQEKQEVDLKGLSLDPINSVKDSAWQRHGRLFFKHIAIVKERTALRRYHSNYRT